VYEVLLEKQAEKDLRGLESDLFTRVIRDIRALGDNPRPSACRKLKGSRGDWRIRVGAYRVLYEIDNRLRVVRVLRIRHRKEAYR
jgi:mRNA interferase RelE/StbE